MSIPKLLLAGTLFCGLPSCAQRTHKADSTDAVSKHPPMATRQETFRFIRAKLLCLARPDSINGTREITFDDPVCRMVITYENRTESIPFAALDGNGYAWDLVTGNAKKGLILRVLILPEGEKVIYNY